MPAFTVNEKLLDRTVAHQVKIQRLAAGTVQQAINRLSDSDAQIYEVIRRRSMDGVLATSRVDKLLATVRNINWRTYKAIEDDLESQLKSMATYEVDYHRDLLGTVLPFEWEVARPKLKFVSAIVDEEPMQGGLLSEWIEGMADGHYTRVRQAIRMGVAAQETADQIIRRIRGRRSLNYKDGAVARSRRSADAIISTMFNHVANLARGTLYAENEDLIEGVQWTAVLDDVTCYHCGALDSTVYPVLNVTIDGKPVAVLDPALGNGPPIHINCRCALVPVVHAWDDLDVPPEELSENVKRELDGRAPKKLSYSKWLADQDKETQEDILGKERAMMFRRGLPVKKFVDSSGRKYTLPELRKIEEKKLAPKKQQKPLMTGLIKRRNYGWKPDLPDQRDLLFAVEEPKEVALPVRVSLRDQMPPVFDQGDLGSCTANALVAAVMFAHGPKTPMLSRLDLYYKERVIENNVNNDDGAEIRDGIKALAKWGVCTEETWPYKIRSFRQRPSAAAAKEDDQWMITKYMRLKSHDDFMKCLAQGYPFVGGFSVYESFDDPPLTNKGIMVMPTIDQKMVGGHAVCYVGYDSDFHSSQIFKDSGLDENDVPALMYEVRNSFASDWGDAGYFWMPAPYVETRDLSDDFWTIRT